MYAQNPQLDSLQKVLKSTESNIKQVDILNEIALSFLSYNRQHTAKQKHYAFQALKLAKQQKYKKGEATALWQLGLVAFINGKHEKGLSYADKALKIAQKINAKKLQARVYDLMGGIYVYSGKFVVSLKNHNRAYDVYATIADTLGMAEAVMNLGNVYWHQHQDFKGLQKFLQSLNLYKSIRNQEGTANAYNKVGQAFQRLYNFTQSTQYHLNALEIYESLGKQDMIAETYYKIASIYDVMDENLKAIEYLLKALKIYQSLNNTPGILTLQADISNIYNEVGDYKNAIKYGEMILKNDDKRVVKEKTLWVTGNLGIAYGGLKQYAQAIPRLKSAIGQLKKNNEKHAVAYLSVHFGKIYLDKQAFNDSEIYLKSGVEIAREINSTKTLISGLEGLYQLYKVRGQNKEALVMHERYNTIKDSVFNIRKEKEIASLQLVYQVGKKQIENNQLKQSLLAQQNKLKQEHLIALLSWGVAGLLFIIIGGLYIAIRRSGKANLLLQEQKTNVLQQNVILQQNEEEIRTKAEIIAEQRDDLIKVNQENHGHLRRITEQNDQLEDALNKLHELNDFKEKTVNMIAHDLKNPLSAVIGLSESLPNTRSRELIYQAGKRMLHLILNMLDVQKFKDTQFVVKTSKQALKELLENALAEIEWHAREKNIEIEYSFQGKVIVEAEADLITRVLINLLQNAIKFSTKNSKVSLAFDYNASVKEIKIAMSDHRQWVDSESLNKMFDKNHRAHSKFTSTALRLSFCKTVVEGHQGKIGVETAQDDTCTFWLTLPVVSYEAYATELPSRPIKGKLPWKQRFSDQERMLLNPYLQQLKALTVYQLTKVKSVLKQIDFSNIIHLNDWKNELMQSLFSANQELYEELIDL